MSVKSAPRSITCPGCGRTARVELGRITTHDRHPLLRMLCPQSGKDAPDG